MSEVEVVFPLDKAVDILDDVVVVPLPFTRSGGSGRSQSWNRTEYTFAVAECRCKYFCWCDESIFIGADESIFIDADDSIFIDADESIFIDADESTFIVAECEYRLNGQNFYPILTST